MNSKFKKTIILITSMLLGGALIVFIGLSTGESVASFISKPIGSSHWETSGGVILACTYVPVLVGIALMLLAIIFSTIVFVEWLKVGDVFERRGGRSE